MPFISNNLEKNIEAVLLPTEEDIMKDMGPMSIKAEFADAVVTAFKLMEIAKSLTLGSAST
jgi:hypothetical protein